MLAKSYHIITPSIFRPSKRSPPPRKIRFRPYATTTQPIPISMPDNRVPTQEVVDDALVALWDYQFLFMSQRLEVPIPIKLKLIEGALPKDFPCGTYYLTGPGLFIDDYGSKIHPLDGHGYLRAFEIDGPNGEVRFSTKYVKTEAQKEECDPISGSWKFTHRGPFSVLKGSKMMSNIKVMKNVANTSILKWGGRLFCLWEGGIPYEIDPQTLDTIGSFNFINDDNDVEDEINFNQSHALDLVARIVKPILHGVFKMPPKRLLSHYKVDAQRRRLIVMACNAEDMVLPRSHYTFYEYDPEFRLLQKKEFTISDHSMVHDWAFTDTHYIIFTNHVKLDILGSMAAICGQAPMISALSVNHSKPTSSIYLLPRFSTNNNSNSQSDDYWRKPIEAPQLWLLHVANAFESIDDNGNLALQIHATACSYQWFNFHKMFAASSGSHQTLSHFPFDSILKFDNLTKRVSIWSPGSRRFVGEPMFVSKRSFVEDNGYLLVIEYVASRRMCNLVILDAERVGGVRAVIARLEVPRSLTFPLGFHGTWTPIE
ncbi:carotenoid cleavage dioxygenase 7, chloroplastic isoform X3 [Beta vulgaris subsp. vulgaris]|uniref:carotenoid cleavage dioxygenase 7, chloroplastic isoform X3 n=1 Tax=Beta vulgaris subsp. vulgaris TaxID=3555 RepID=UPI00053FABA6|nr:carotenoid cleavage dioxygenase 7, chloroplastic isoform X3 [Beta vulgaris subsp. vulgaris]